MINFKHLHYFWVVAKQGGVARASEVLHLTPQTISGQINLLEDNLGQPLFRRSGHNLELTETGRLALSYADEMLTLGSELEESLRVYPRIVGEFDDSALMKVFGQAGSGLFIAPTAIAEEVKSHYGVEQVGQTDAVREQFYATSVERRITHPAVAAITQTARRWLK